MADNATRPAWMSFINFDGRITGETAQVIEQVAESLGEDPQTVIQHILTWALSEKLGDAVRRSDVKVEPMTINTGNGGFHVVTVVADGYGNLVAENQAGEEQARVKVDAEDDAADTADDLKRLMDAWHVKVQANHAARLNG